MIENYLMYLEICKQLYVNNDGLIESNECLNKYTNLLDEEYEKLSQEEKQIVTELITTMKNQSTIERNTSILTLETLQKDAQLNNIFPGHIKAKYSNQLKKASKEQHFLQSVLHNLINKKEAKTK